jgi:hypothetical protein
MPNRYAVASSNWSSLATWDGGLSLPTASDDVFANNQTVTVDQNIVVRSLQNLPTGSIVGNGTFISTNGISVTSSLGIIAASGSLFIVTGSDSVTFSSSFSTTGLAQKIGSLVLRTTGTTTIIGNITASGAANSNTILMDVPGTIIVTGSFLNNAATTATNAHGLFLITGSLCSISGSLNGTAGISNFTNYNLRISGSCPVTITGSVSGGRSQSVYNQLNPQTVNILGNCTVVWTGGSSTITIQHLAAGSMNIIGNLYANGAGAVVTNTGVGILNVVGNLTSDQGGGNQPAVINNASTGTVIVTGSVSTGTATAAITSTTAGTIIVNGPIYSSNTTPGISSTSTSATVRVTGPLISSQNNINPIFSPRIQFISSSIPFYTLQSDTFGKNVTLFNPDYPPTYPSSSDVRSGSLYGTSNEFSGSMVIPSTSSVRYGVPVDTFTGSATLTPLDILNYATQNLTSSNTIGARLKDIATVQTTAATIAVFKGR